MIHASDGSVAALLGASPCVHGGSCDADGHRKMFPAASGNEEIQEMVSYGLSLRQNPDLLRKVEYSTAEILG